ncbi:ABC-type multidrug transport system ATPase subunit [Anseongella ginsenosidimutans]|uniref:ABC-type multidrug transport system ATPase subunit n=1 Tax=Anseongella ginsenosidimutans TaxID=496056 RepID=A0A4R3KWS2_9SPHI|nr:ATP-binding cassette domain-containing protein [Anseongella ginsenosidimutans]QEC51436.1 ABC transporter ATP-binding protein [Anseongella ginsenosidimutans]TCS89858.1 ABC-type multidrug transport system ATPase subunit [Anseongella ginsenosidimutans]
MDIEIKKLGRRFNRDWIFRNMNYRISSGGRYAVLGPNGSGKSTFLQVISGSLTPSEGDVVYRFGNTAVEVEKVYEQLSLAAPYLELVEEFTLAECIDFHFRFKTYIPGTDASQVIRLLGFEKFAGREIRYFSSGMKQRLKLVLAVCSDTPLLLLDEPTANFDEQGISWYHSLIERFSPGRTLIICSNQPHEYDFCTERISVLDFK